MRKHILYLLLALVLMACSSEAPAAPEVAVESGSTNTTEAVATEAVATEVPAEPTAVPELVEEAVEVVEESEEMVEEVSAETSISSADWTTAWILNEDGETSSVFDGVTVNVSNVYVTTIDGKEYQCIQSAGIPNYNSVVDQAMIDGLENRPKGDEFDGTASPAVALGDSVMFGESVGYTPGMGCTDVGGGYGYWPGGPACPTEQTKDWCFPLDPDPLPDGDLCSTSLNQIGVYVNGVSIFNWQDGQSYNNAGVWVNDAFAFEIYDLDICVGHSANGNYHHHSNPTCLGEQLGDDGSSASPIYGFAADGYPIYGPYESAGELVSSCWKTRDYSAGSATGCGADGDRSCVLVDQFDISQGVMDAESAGPATDEYITSMSGNPILAESGAYFQDYYYDAACTAQGDTYLDEHNGHYSEALGYHYHTTLVALADGTLDYAFPHYAGPTYAGVLQDNAIASCGTFGGGGNAGPGGGGRGGGGGAQGGAPDFAAAALALGVNEDALRDAIGGPPPNFEAAAETLGVSVETIQNAMGGGAP